MDEPRWTEPEATALDRELDRSLRPRTLDEFIGQDALKANLRVFVAAARGRGGLGARAQS